MGLGSKAKQIIENIFNYFPIEPAGDITAAIQQTVQATGVGLTTVYKKRSEAKSTGGLDILFLDFFFSFQKLMKR